MSHIYFILLGVIAYVLSILILGQFMDQEVAIYFSPFAYIVIVIVFFLLTKTQRYFIPKITDKMEIDWINHIPERREYTRYNVDKFTVEVKKNDGTTFSALLNNISFVGFQILGQDLAAQNISQKTDFLMENVAPQVELTVNIPLEDHVEQIVANCKLTYITENESKSNNTIFAAGLQLAEFKSKFDYQIIAKFIQNQAATYS